MEPVKLVRIVRGPLKGVLGTVQEKRPQSNQIIMHADVVGRGTTIHVEADAVVFVPSKNSGKQTHAHTEI